MPMTSEDCLPIEEHGVIGDLHTAALVTTDGAIDFLCFPRFDSPSVFASLLDRERGGCFRIAPVLPEVRHQQSYLPDTGVLLTRFLERDGLAELSDFMPIETADADHHDVVRRVKSIRGTLRYRMECRPRFDYARCGHRVERVDGALVFVPDRRELGAIRLRASVPLELANGDAVADFELGGDDRAWFSLERADDTPESSLRTSAHVAEAFKATVNDWRRWAGRCRYTGRWRDTVLRSALTLRMLISRPHGSMVAAVTFGLPEAERGERNWDYRFTWIRDASFAVAALLRLGYHEEAHDFFRWIEDRCTQPVGERSPLQPLYRVDGGTELRETSLDHLAGYRGARPVRIGNAAADQLQLDLYGELLQALDLADAHGALVHHDLWAKVAPIVDWVARNWRQPDDGIWETRAGRREFVHSRVLCWVAIDRAMRIAQRRSLPAPLDTWRDARDGIYASVMEQFWNPRLGAFTQHRGGETLDGSTLLLPLVGFVSPTDPRWLSTLRALRERLVADSLVHRYVPGRFDDGLPGVEGTFTACTFWYVEALARAGDLRQARLVFEKTLAYANHLGLFAEQLAVTGEQRGNFPQALTHLALINTATDLDARLSLGREEDL
jgi:GH15 family glucan-1,4-alpha-glucosidase